MFNNSFKRFLSIFLIFFAFLFSVSAKEKEDLSTWTKIVEKMEIHLNNAYELYTQGKTREAYDEVNAAYFRYYESKGMEKITMSYLSGARKTAVENAFYEYRKNVKSDKDSEMIREEAENRRLLQPLFPALCLYCVKAWKLFWL